MPLTKTSWPSGWTPDADQVNGDPSGLLRMDNLQLEETGALSLVRGIQELNGNLPDWVDRFYSRLINNTEYIWAALNVTSSSIVRTSNNFGSITTVLTGGGARACFGEAFGNVLISAGTQRVKDNGTTTPVQLGIQTPLGIPGTPVITAINQQQSNIVGTFAPILGTGFISEPPASAVIFVDPVTLIGSFQCTLTPNTNTVNFGIPGLNPNQPNPGNDIFSMLWQPGNPNNFTTLTVSFWLDSTGTNAYSYTWNAATDVLQGIDVQTIVTILRSQFTRTGTDGTLDWTTVQSIVFTAQAITVDKFLAGEATFVGGQQGSLNSDYTYICYMVANNSLNGPYVAMSGPSPVSAVASIYNGYASVQLPTSSDPQVNQCWLYRISVTDQRTSSTPGGIQTGTQVAPALPQYLLVAMSTPGAVVQDTVTDDQALQQNIPANLNLISLQSIADTIISMDGLFNTRMLYVSPTYVFLSDSLDPDAIDGRFTLKVSGDAAEQNLFIKTLTNNTMILATTKDLYYISGTLTALPDGTLDITVQSIGEAYPPLSSDFCFNEGCIYYVAADGLRYTTGSNSIRIGGLDLLWQGMTRYGIAGVAIYAGNQAGYSLTYGRGGKLYASLPLLDGTRVLCILALAEQTAASAVYNPAQGKWRLQYTDPVTVFATQTGLVLLGYNLSSNMNLAGGVFLLDSGYGITNSSGGLIEGVPITFQTVCDANGEPRSRKDTFTLKIICDTGNSPVSVYVSIDNGSFLFVGNITHNGIATAYFNMDPFTLGFRYAFKLVDVNLLTYFKLYELTLEYDARPPQLDFMRIQNDNLGSISRKRIINYAFVIDTLGNNVIFTPLVDNTGTVPSTTTVNNPVKDTFIHYFTQETIGTDVGGTLVGGPFEFYGLNTQEIISEKCPVPCKFLVIPANNYGTPSRKRHTSYKFQINTRGTNVTFTPILDGTAYPTAVYNTSIKQTVEYYFPTTTDVIGIDIGGTLSGTSPFEFYGDVKPQQVEELPALLQSYYLPVSNLGTPARKRLKTIPIVINTMGNTVNFIITIDGSQKAPLAINTTYKATVFYYFTYDNVGVDFEATLQSLGGPFECYGLSLQDCIAQTLPAPTEYLLIPPNNYGTPSRKRFTSYKFQIDTRETSVTFTPIVDGISYAPLIFTTNGEETIEYFFTQTLDVKGIDIGGILTGGPFEFYGPVVPEKIETLPPRLESLYPPHDNFGTPARKRIRTIPLTIYTYGQNVVYTPNIDGVNYPSAIFNTTYKQTVYYYFISDMFGIDVGGNFQGNYPFEFYGFLTPETVEVLPVPKRYDQFQPMRFDRIGKIFLLRIRLISTADTSIPFSIYGDGSPTLPGNTTPLYSSQFSVVPNTDTTVEIDLPKNVNGNILRLTLGPTTSPFHRYDVQVKVSTSGMESDSEWRQLR